MNLLYNTSELQIKTLKNIIISKYPSLEKNNIKAFFLKQLSPADLLPENKPAREDNKKSNTYHIACTGPGRNFFYEAYGSVITNTDYKTQLDSTRQIPIFVESKYTSNTTTNDFIKSTCAIWIFPKKNGANQLGLSKISIDGEDFINLRKNAYEKDVLIFFKYITNPKEVDIYTLLLKSTENISEIQSLEINNPQYWEDIIDDNVVFESDASIDLFYEKKTPYNNSTIIGINKMFLGAPGTGKSNFVHNNYFVGNQAKRVTFHPEYSYYDFVGSIKPCVKEGTLTYEFVPGIFTEILTDAFTNPNIEFNLIIEELNRANTAAVFGDLFQLLDRKCDGNSEYPIFNRDIINYINSKININNHITELIIPNNLNIIATMNSSDQNIFIMDTAFKRRWDVEYIPIKFDNTHTFKDLLIPGLNISWEFFVTNINNFMLSSLNSDLMISEDKQLGPYFIKKHELDDISKFSYKVFLYLWDDVFKMDRYRLFNPEIRSFSQLIDIYKDSPLNIFNNQIAELFETICSSNEDN